MEEEMNDTFKTILIGNIYNNSYKGGDFGGCIWSRGGWHQL